MWDYTGRKNHTKAQLILIDLDDIWAIYHD